MVLTYPERAPDYYTDALVERLFPQLQEPPKEVKSAKDLLLKPQRNTIEPKTRLSAFLADQIPPIELYSRTVEALAFYRNIQSNIETTPQPKIPRSAAKLRKGLRSPVVETLRKRLAMEGYLPKELGITPLYDPT